MPGHRSSSAHAIPAGCAGSRSAFCITAMSLIRIRLVSRDGGQSFTLLQQDDRKGLSAAVAVGGSALLTVGEAGVKLISFAPGRAHAVARVEP